MKNRIIIIVLAFFFPLIALAQEPKTPEQEEKEFRETLDKEIDNLSDLLSLNDSQIFYIDSIMTHDFKAMQKEMDSMQKKNITNRDLYLEVNDKWAEKIYMAMKKVLSSEQWAKYNKIGAAKEKKERDKRAAKRNKK